MLFKSPRRMWTSNWKMTPEMIQASKTYANHMLELKQIKQLPDFDAFFNTKFSDELAKA